MRDFNPFNDILFLLPRLNICQTYVETESTESRVLSSSPPAVTGQKEKNEKFVLIMAVDVLWDASPSHECNRSQAKERAHRETESSNKRKSQPDFHFLSSISVASPFHCKHTTGAFCGVNLTLPLFTTKKKKNLKKYFKRETKKESTPLYYIFNIYLYISNCSVVTLRTRMYTSSLQPDTR